MAKKCSTDQRFIRKRNTTYKIHTLALNHTFGVGVDETELAAETTGTLLEAEDGGGIGGKGPVMAAEPAIMVAVGAV